MKALMKVARGPGNVEIREIPIPKIPKDDWVLIKIKVAGVCGTDLHILHDQFRYWPPVVLGHEFSGEIVEMGSAVKGLNVGDRIVGEPQTGSCGTCELCRQGKLNICSSKRAPGWGIDGAFADYLVMPAFLLHKIPEGVSWEIAALAEPMAITVHEVLERGKIECQDFVVVSGSGPIGILAAFVAKSAGASKVVMTGLSAGEYVRFDVARKLGVDHIINVEKENPVEKILEMTNGRGADMVIEASGAGSAILQALDMVRTCGRICAVGLTGKELVNFAWNKAMYKALDINFNFSSSYTAWDRALSLMANTKTDLNALITHKTSIDKWEKVFKDLEEEKGVKALFIPKGNL
ncbi:MAG: zinc-binding dehydrogenase [Lentisphaerae bacterium]|nr:zinc-binding dehydrogenase [Lentisphaerota bacterium]